MHLFKSERSLPGKLAGNSQDKTDSRGARGEANDYNKGQGCKLLRLLAEDY